MRKYRIVFIDDEEIIREGLLSLVNWEAHGIEVAGVFKSGKTAWEFLQNHPVDIVLSDINMPFLNGIELLEKIRDKGYKTKVLLLTGYADFEYAKMAVQLKAQNFLLKPITTPQLLEAVRKATLEIEQEEMANEAIEKTREVSQSEFISSLLYGRIPEKHILEKAENLGIPIRAEKYAVVVIAIDSVGGLQISDVEIDFIKNNLKQFLRDIKLDMKCRMKQYFSLYFAKDNSIYIPMLLATDDRSLFTKEFFEAFTERLLVVEDAQNYQLTAAFSECFDYLPKAEERFQDVLQTLKSRHILGIGQLLFASNTIKDREIIEKLVLPTDILLYHIRMGMSEAAKEDIKGIFDIFRKDKFISKEYARLITTELAITVFKGEVESDKGAVSYLYYLNYIQQLNSLEEMEQEITCLAVKIAEQRKQNVRHKRILVDNAIQYMQNNYGNQELSLHHVASFLNISVPYMVVLFKQEENSNFSTLLSSMRIKKAKELLATTSMTNNEIAEKVGYSSAQYFSVCFKKQVGISPGKYREQNIKN